LYAVHNEHTALDIVQDAMIKLAEKYSGKPAAEYPMLFQRILQNTVRDHFRRQKVRNFWSTLISSFSPAGQDQDHDPLETLEVKGSSSFGGDPAVRMEQAQTLQWIEEALEGLPARQRQAFLLRYWEDLDVSEAAAAMGLPLIPAVLLSCSPRIIADDAGPSPHFTHRVRLVNGSQKSYTRQAARTGAPSIDALVE